MTEIRQIKEYLKNNGIQKNWLATKLNVSQSHLSLVLSEKRPLSKKSLRIINTLWPDVTFPIPEHHFTDSKNSDS